MQRWPRRLKINLNQKLYAGALSRQSIVRLMQRKTSVGYGCRVDCVIFTRASPNGRASEEAKRDETGA
jgi:hypothetical protein